MVFPAKMKWSDRIRFVRNMRRQTQEAAAEAIGTTRKQIYLWENGLRKPDKYSRKKLSEWAQVPEDQLFRGIGGKN